jgi:uncharacterized protein YcbK (DUF882 family)
MKLSRNFDLEEFRSGDGAEFPLWVVVNLKDLAKNLQVLRDELKKPIEISSGYRSPNYNDVILPARGIKTAKNSYHKKGMAADIKVAGVDPKTVERIILSLTASGKMMKGGIKAYQTFTHYDIRGYYASW